MLYDKVSLWLAWGSRRVDAVTGHRLTIDQYSAGRMEVDYIGAGNTGDTDEARLRDRGSDSRMRNDRARSRSSYSASSMPKRTMRSTNL